MGKERSTAHASFHKMDFQSLLFLLRILQAKYQVRILKDKCCFCGKCFKSSLHAGAEVFFSWIETKPAFVEVFPTEM
jgi:hypothetical protein